MDTLIGKTLSRYRIVEKIGAGGMGEVYRGHGKAPAQFEVRATTTLAPDQSAAAARMKP